MKESRVWLGVFLGVVVGACAFIAYLIPFGTAFNDGNRLLSIFLGMLGGTSLGEYFKKRNNEKSGRALSDDLVDELTVNQELLREEIPLRKGFWILGIRSGRAEYLPEPERKMLWETYSRITHYNDEIQRLHWSNLGIQDIGEDAPLRGELTKLQEEIYSHIEQFLKMKGGGG
ncbi:MAG: hypothetical protein BAJATHORv1_20003 [Candidatus Thorarchaeota archaeon]|nr:MAG: hypothetical protein BAJATHORv1_20003 [Candidatus Thorarchaeota archaeon]